MIFGHLGIAFLLKSKFYKRSLILLIICCLLPDLLYYLLLGIQYLILLINPTLLIVQYVIPITHSVILYVIFILFYMIFSIPRNQVVSALIYGAAILSHLLFDFLLPDANMGVPLVYLLYPFDSSIFHFLPYISIDANLFWFLDLLVFIIGFFVILWAFSKYEGREYEIEEEPIIAAKSSIKKKEKEEKKK
ncbi:MAG: hypothetical protein ACTSRS_13465 [Candidatus Helarchaeota archaeon]